MVDAGLRAGDGAVFVLEFVDANLAANLGSELEAD